MTGRKFTPPTEFPAEYVNGFGDKVTLLVRGKGDFSLIGQYENNVVSLFTESGRYDLLGNESPYDLHDIPQKQVHWANDYDGNYWSGWWKSREDADRNVCPDRIAVIRREWTEGELPQYFTEEV